MVILYVKSVVAFSMYTTLYRRQIKNNKSLKMTTTTFTMDLSPQYNHDFRIIYFQLWVRSLQPELKSPYPKVLLKTLFNRSKHLIILRLASNHDLRPFEVQSTYYPYSFKTSFETSLKTCLEKYPSQFKTSFKSMFKASLKNQFKNTF